MYTVQLVLREENVCYFKDGILMSDEDAPKTSEEKLHHSLTGETRVMKTETVVDTWRCKTKGDAAIRYWNYIDEDGLDYRNYFLVYSK